MEKVNMTELMQNSKRLETKAMEAKIGAISSLNEFMKSIFEVYKKCNHYTIKCFDDYDWYEGTHDYSYGCIKCKLCNGGYFFENYMKDYFELGGHLSGYRPDVNLSFGRFGCYEVSFGRAIKIYEKLVAENPNITNKEIDEILSKKAEEFFIIDTETNNKESKGPGRKRGKN